MIRQWGRERMDGWMDGGRQGYDVYDKKKSVNEGNRSRSAFHTEPLNRSIKLEVYPSGILALCSTRILGSVFILTHQPRVTNLLPTLCTLRRLNPLIHFVAAVRSPS